MTDPLVAYVAYPSSLRLRSANAIQTFCTCRALRQLLPGLRVVVPRLPFRRSAFRGVGAVHLPRLPFNVLSHLFPTTVWSYLERSTFAVEVSLYLLIEAARRGRRWDALYVRDVICAFWLSWLAIPFSSRRLIYEVHDLEHRHPSRQAGRFLRAWLRLVDRRTIRAADTVVSLTSTFVADLKREGRQPGRPVAVIPDAFDEALYRPLPRLPARERLGLPRTGFIVTYAGLTFRYRGLETLLAAFARVRERDPLARLCLVGGRPFEIDELKRTAGRLGLDGSALTLPGAVAADRVPAWLAAADVLVIPGTVTTATASPLKMFEYLAMHRPIVSVDLPALREVLDEGCARFFPAGDAEALAAAILALAEDRALGERMAEAGSQRAGQYTYALRARQILRLVDPEEGGS